jgi:hypothetical protein
MKQNAGKIMMETRHLLLILQQEWLLGKKQLEKAGELTEALLNMQHEKVQLIQVEIQTLMDAQEEIDLRRAETARTISFLSGLTSSANDPAPTLTRMMHIMSEDEKKAFRTIQTDILIMETQLKIANERNSQLIHSVLDYIQHTIQCIADTALKPVRYGINPHAHSRPSFYVDQRC